MALKGTTAQERAWNFFCAKGLSHYAVSGVMASIRAESGFNPRNLQNSCEKKSGYTDETYTAAVDNGSYGNFVRDSYGYGYAQWTYWSRKQNLLNFAKKKNKSIGDEEMQLEFLWEELTGSYKGVLTKLKAAKSTQEASDIILTGYEKPKDQGQKVKATSGSYAKEYYNQFAVKKEEKTMKVIIGSARRDENGKYAGGKPGDQDGVEVSTQNYYVHTKGWYLYRPINPEHAKKLAQAMYDACMNDNVGYCQTHRSIITMLKKYGSMKAIAEKTETDCSNLVRGCIYEATGKDAGNFNTSTEPTALEKTGLFEKKVAVTASTQFKPGDILVTKTKGHTVVVVSVDGSTPSSTSTPAKPAASTSSSKKVESAKSKDAAIAGKYKTTGNLYLRVGAGTGKTAITLMPKGSDVQCYGYYTSHNGTRWYYVAYGNLTGFCSSEYLKRA